MKNQLWSYARTFRVINLLIIVLSMFLVRRQLILPLLEEDFRQASALNEWQFALLVLATLCIATAGYLLNDYFDKDIDRVNHPERKGATGWGERTTVITCLMLDLLGIGLGYAIAWWVGNLHVGMIFVLAAALLLVYSRYLKKIVLVGNLTVSALAALVILLPGLVEPGLLHSDDPVYQQAAMYIWKALIGYGIFAFIATFIREVIKDTEDMQGDAIGGRHTIPIVIGEKATKFVIILLLLMMVRGLVFVQQRFIVDGNLVLPAYVAVLIEMPAIACMLMTYRGNSVKDYSQLSGFMKFIMVMGILSMLIYKPIL